MNSGKSCQVAQTPAIWTYSTARQPELTYEPLPLCGLSEMFSAQEGWRLRRPTLLGFQYEVPRQEELVYEPIQEVGEIQLKFFETVPSEKSDTLSANLKNEVPAERILNFHTAKQISNQTSAAVEWIAEPWVAQGAITEVDGKIKAAGKTTWVTHLCRRVLDGEQFMGRPTKKTGVIYLSEQPAQSFREALRRADLLDRDDFTTLFWHDTVGIQWSEVMRLTVSEAKKRGAGLIVVDTLPQFAGLRGDSENNTGDALRAVQPLQEAAAKHGLAVIVIRHERKSGGEVGDSARGSSAFSGAVDIVLSIKRAEGNSASNVRVIHAVGRFDETPSALTIELADDGYQALGTDTDVMAQRAKRALLDVVPVAECGPLSTEDLISKTRLARTTLQNALEQLLASGALIRLGSGTKGSPYRYCRPQE